MCGIADAIAILRDQPGRELNRLLILRHQERQQVGFDELCKLIENVHREWQPQRLYIEGEKLGRAATDQLHRQLPISCLPTGIQDKATRASSLIIKLERGEIFLPRLENNWRPLLEAEWLSWTGHDREPADQIDAAAYAASRPLAWRPGTVWSYSSGTTNILSRVARRIVGETE